MILAGEEKENDGDEEEVKAEKLPFWSWMAIPPESAIIASRDPTWKREDKEDDGESDEKGG